jgi:hypothetical protein
MIAMANIDLENAAIGIGGSAIADLFREFVVRKFMPKGHKEDAVQP